MTTETLNNNDAQLTVTQPTSLIERAIEQGANIETLEKLMALQERFEANRARKLFFEEFTAFQADCPERSEFFKE